ncbi:MAG TPA: DNA polymerase III subunit delta' [Burkholderiales bacterium]|nr:DNA polymerase III subunit delta' [Burkholderiales bacterium]
MSNILPWHSAAFATLWKGRDRLPHALLIHGKQGTGKLRFATALAHGLLCERPSPEGPCGVCPACRWTTASSHPDLRHVEPLAEEQDEEEGAPAKKKNMQIVVEQVRALSDFLTVSTHRGGWRPVLLHPAEALNPSAANALLKSLEEPPAQTLFILVSHRLHQVLPTIKSRCRLVPLPTPSRTAAAAWLKSEGVEQPELAAAHTGGAPLAAIDLPIADYWDQRRRFLRHVAVQRIDALTAADECQEVGIPLMLEWMEKWTYDIAALKMSGEVRYNIDHEEAITRLAAGCDELRMLRFHRELIRMQRHAHHPLNARLFAEQLMMSYAQAAASRSHR